MTDKVNTEIIKTKYAPRAEKTPVLRYRAPEMKVFSMKKNIQGGAQQLQEGNDGALS